MKYDREHYSTADELRPGCLWLVWGMIFLGMAALILVFLVALVEATP